MFAILLCGSNILLFKRTTPSSKALVKFATGTGIYIDLVKGLAKFIA
jgi:hypothetical protein